MHAILRFSAEALATEKAVPVLIEFQQAPVAIFRLKNPSATAAEIGAYEAQLRTAHNQFIEELRGTGLQCEVSFCMGTEAVPGGVRPIMLRHEFTHVFNGVGLMLPGNAVPEVAAHPMVRAVTHNTEQPYLLLDRSVAWTGAPLVWKQRDQLDQPILGHGITIAVIDTGIDWSHPAFGGFKDVPNPKITYAVSYTGEAPMDNFGHGTHVAGICAGDLYQATPRGDSTIRGVAPGAQLVSYKVLSGSGQGTATSIVMAVEEAAKRGVHVMNLSLGDSTGDPNSPESVACNNAMLAGISVCVAAGNSGPGANTIGSPGAAAHVVTVGASTDDGVTALFARIGTDESARRIEIRPLGGSVPLATPPLTSQYVDCTSGQTASDFPASVKGRVALVRRGENPFREKVKLAEAAGAVASVIYNNQPGHFSGTLGSNGVDDPLPKIPAVCVSQEDGAYLASLPKEADGAFSERLTLDPTPVVYADRLAEFSSRGPTLDGQMKPDLCAPGVDIYSATILPEMAPNEDSATMADPSGCISSNGTSMATPHVAGACALLKQLYPEWDSLKIKAVLMNTANVMQGQGSANDQGSGKIDLAAAIRAAYIVVEASTNAAAIDFGEVSHVGKTQALRRTFRLISLRKEGASHIKFQVNWPKRPQGLSVRLGPKSITLAAGEVAEFDLLLRVDGSRVSDGVYFGRLAALDSDSTAWVPFRVTIRTNQVDTLNGKQEVEQTPRLPIPAPDPEKCQTA